MITHSSSTAEYSSNVSERVATTLRKVAASQSDARIARIERVRIQIKDLETRGFIKRQVFASPTTSDFERMAYLRK